MIGDGMPKIALIGGGNIGGTLAHLISARHLGDVVMIDAVSGIAEGKILDLSQGGTLHHSTSKMIGTTDYQCIEHSDVVIVTAGIARKPGMSRDDLVKTNTMVMQSVGAQIKKYAPHAFVIVVTNPLDTMVWVMKHATGFHKSKVVGMAGVLDTARYTYFLSQYLGVCPDNIQTIVMGGHGDTMVPLQRYTTIAGVPLSEWIKTNSIPQKDMDDIVKRTRFGGGEIVELLKTGSAYYAPAESALVMATAYLRDEKRILPCAAYLEGEYGISGLFIGVPVVIGKNGVERIIELDLDAQERDMLHQSSHSVRKLVDELKI
jgi:malate dehydrogenase